MAAARWPVPGRAGDNRVPVSGGRRGHYRLTVASLSSSLSDPGDPRDDALIEADAERRELDAEVVERVEVEQAATPWGALLAGSLGREVALEVAGVTHRGIVEASGSDWCLLESDGSAVLVPLSQVVTATGLHAAAPNTLSLAGIGSVLRRWRRMRSVVTVQLRDGSARSGQVAEVLADAFTLSSSGDVAERVTIPGAAVRWVSGDPVRD